MSTEVYLSDDDVESCHALALVIDAQEEAAGHSRRFPWVTGQPRPNFVGRLGELAVSYLIGVEYKFDPTYNKTWNDVSIYEVRTTTHSNGHLITYHKDKPAPYVLVTLSEGFHIATIQGWLPLEKCNIDAHYRASHDSYWTPQSELFSMDGVFA